MGINGFASCAVDLTLPVDALVFRSQSVGQEATAGGDVDVSLNTKRAILSDKSNVLPYETTRQRILDYYLRADGDADIQTDQLKVTLICPVSIRPKRQLLK